MSELDSWMQATVILAGNLMIAGILKWLHEKGRIPEWAGHLGIGATGLLAGLLYWLRLTPDKNHSVLLLSPFAILTAWLFFDLHSRHLTHKRIRELEKTRSATSPSVAAPPQPPLPIPPTGFSVSRAALPGAVSPDHMKPNAMNAAALGVALPHLTMESRVSAAPLPSPLALFVGNARGIGIVRSLMLESDRRAYPDHFKWRCQVEHIGIASDVKASPWELILTGMRGTPVLAKMTTKDVATGRGITEYEGFASNDAMIRAVAKTVGKEKEMEGSLMDANPLLIAVEIRLPDGTPLGNHHDTGVKMLFELLREPCHSMIIRYPA